MSAPTITTSANGGVLHLTLNRPELRNAMSLAMVLELRQALAAAEADGTTRIVVLRGAGGHFCAGGGFGLACVADVAIAADNAVFRLPETSLGVVPAQIAPFLVERLGYAEAKRLAVTGGRIDAAQALALRLVHEVHPGVGLDAAIERNVHAILQCAPGAIAATKALIRQARLRAPASLVHEASMVFSRAALGPEGTEGTAAFLHKRKPNWAPPT